MKRVTFLLLIFIVLSISQIFFSVPQVMFDPPESTSDGIVEFYLLEPEPIIFIHRPENKTYNFNYSSINTYSLDLNVSSNFGADNWSYTFSDLKHNVLYSTIFFEPNISINVTRWQGRATVFGENEATGIKANASVTFFVNVSNHAPTLSNFSDILACEGSIFNATKFNATDIDGDWIVLWINDPRLHFFSAPNNPTHPNLTIYPGILGQAGYSFRWNTFYLGTSSGILTKEHTRFVHELTLLAKDCENCPPEGHSDSRNVNITVIETNEKPVFGRVANRTIELDLDEANYTLYLEMNVTDVEDGNASSGNLTFNTTFLSGGNIFNVSRFGIINFTPDISQQGFYKIKVCASDLGLNETRIHENISLCGFGAADVKTSCGEFNLTITKDAIVIDSPPAGDGGGGGGGGSPLSCEARWICEEWNQCELTSTGLEEKRIIGEDYRFAKQSCEQGFLGNDVCGFQRRNCVDILGCNLTRDLPALLDSCYYTENPDCLDGIKNCHDGKCEFLVDCGGPCGQCATCSDGIQNQGEEAIDCGGPCPNSCPIEIPAGTEFLNYLLYAILGILVIVVVVLIYRFRKRRKEL